MAVEDLGEAMLCSSCSSTTTPTLTKRSYVLVPIVVCSRPDPLQTPPSAAKKLINKSRSLNYKPKHLQSR